MHPLQHLPQALLRPWSSTPWSNQLRTEQVPILEPSLAGPEPLPCLPQRRQALHPEQASVQGMPRLIRVGDRLRPLPPMIPADQLAEAELDIAITQFRAFMQQRGIHLATLSPNIQPRELYKFMTGPLLELPIRNLETPGMYCFVYDDFHPDPYFENEWVAMEHCLRPLVNLAPLAAFLAQGEMVALNQHPRTDADACRLRLRQFREQYAAIVSLRCEAIRTTIRDQFCTVTGVHETGLCGPQACDIVRGYWRVEFDAGNDGSWTVSRIWIEGLKL